MEAISEMARQNGNRNGRTVLLSKEKQNGTANFPRCLQCSKKKNLELPKRGLQATLDGGIESSAVVVERLHVLRGGSSGGDQGLSDSGEGVGETLPQSLGMAGGVRLRYLLGQQLALTVGRERGERERGEVEREGGGVICTEEGEKGGRDEESTLLTVPVQLLAAVCS